MPRKPLIKSNEHFYHLTARSNNKENFYLPIGKVWEIFCKEIELLQKKYNLEILAFVLMNNHYHLVMRTPLEQIDRVMFFLMMNTTKKIQKETGRINKVFGGRYKGSIILEHNYLCNVYKYVYLNPVRASICSKAEQYPYSTLSKNSYHNIRILKFSPSTLYKMTEKQILSWINSQFEKRESDSIKYGLSRTEFCYKKENSTGKEITPKK